MDWQPIETAPDGEILVYFADKMFRHAQGMAVCERGKFRAFFPCGVSGPEWDFDYEKPTHWMPLPNPPSPICS